MIIETVVLSVAGILIGVLSMSLESLVGIFIGIGCLIAAGCMAANHAKAGRIPKTQRKQRSKLKDLLA